MNTVSTTRRTVDIGKDIHFSNYLLSIPVGHPFKIELLASKEHAIRPPSDLAYYPKGSITYHLKRLVIIDNRRHGSSDAPETREEQVVSLLGAHDMNMRVVECANTNTVHINSIKQCMHSSQELDISDHMVG